MATVATLGTVSLVMNQLLPFVEKEVNLHLNSQEQAEKLTANLNKIRELLDRAMGKHLADPDVKRSLDVLETTAMEMEDALDQWKIAEQVPEGRASDWSLSFWEAICSSVYSLCSTLNEFSDHRRVAMEVNNLNEIVDQVYEKAKTELNLAPTSRGTERPKSVPTIVQAEFPGRESDKETVKKMVEEDIPRGGSAGIPYSVVAILAEGGLGKTALAQLVYNDYKAGAEGGFSKKMWVCVTENFDADRIAKEILKYLAPNQSASVSSADDSERIKDLLTQQKFLLVLDDVWNDNHVEWGSMRGYLSSGAQGSVILMTTRKETAATSIAEATKYQIHSLQPLDDMSCWSIIERLASQGKGRQFETLGMEIAKKCKGSPLVAHILGGHLRHKAYRRDWEHVLKSETWELKNVKDDLFRSFFLSYDELESAAKRCFSYCAVFPKDTTLDVKQLILIWMAQGFLFSPDDNDMQQRGKDCFDELAQRCFFQNFEKDIFGQIVRCKMHDLVHDFAQYLMEDKCHTVEKAKDSDPMKNVQNSRHLYMAETSNEIPISNLKLEKLRSFYSYGKRYVNLGHLKCVRALTLSNYWLQGLTLFYESWRQEEIRSLVHLRYLCLHSPYVDIKVPEAVSSLYNLETLYLQGHLSSLPQRIDNLKRLKYIILDRHPSRKFKFPDRFERLTSLRGLNFFYNYGGSNHFGCLEKMNQLGGDIYIYMQFMKGEEHVKDAEKAQLRDKQFLESLRLEYDAVDTRVLDALQPHPNLQRLWCYGDGELPRWIPNISKLIELQIYLFSSTNTKLPCTLAKLQFLEHLSIKYPFEHLGRDFVGLNNDGEDTASQRMEDIVSFPALKTLGFIDCGEWQEWEDIEEEEIGAAALNLQIMPRLTHLKLTRCWRLKMLPHRLLQAVSSLQNLQIENCGIIKLPSSLAKLQYLEHLSISTRRLEHLGRDFLGLTNDDNETRRTEDIVSFPALKTLVFDGCVFWEEWEDITEEESGEAAPKLLIMPRLTHLTLVKCWSLKNLPHRLLQAASSLQHLQIKNCGDWGKAFGDKNEKPRIPYIIISDDYLNIP